MREAIIFDIDGTLADVEHRRHHVQGGNTNWGAFFDEMVFDPPLADVVFLAELIADRSEAWNGEPSLFLFSGRPETHRPQTETWLNEHVPNYFNLAQALLMRAADDFRPDTVVKREMLALIRGQGYEPRIVIDDRPSVVQMWKDEGITVLAHDSGEWDETPVTWKPGKLTLMVGPSGAGKTTWILNHTITSLDKTVSTDNLRHQITGSFQNQTANSQVFAVAHALIKAHIEGGLDLIVDATNLRARDRRAIRDLVPTDTDIQYIIVDRPLADKHRDAGWRDEVVIKGMKLIDRHHQSFKSGLKYILAGDDDPRVTVHDHRSS